MEGQGHCEEECRCHPVCQCVACPKRMRAQLSVSSRSFTADDTLHDLLSAVPGVESVRANLLQNVAEVRGALPVCSVARAAWPCCVPHACAPPAALPA